MVTKTKAPAKQVHPTVPHGPQSNLFPS